MKPTMKRWLYILMLLLICLSCYSRGILTLNVTQSSYEGEEGSNITLEWSFSTTKDLSLHELNIDCLFLGSKPSKLFFHPKNGIVYQDRYFKGRVWCDEESLREGLIPLRLSNLSTNDSGRYLCEVAVGQEKNSKTCTLNVTAKIQGEDDDDDVVVGPQQRGRTALYVVLAAAVVVAACCLLLPQAKKNTRDQDRGIIEPESQFPYQPDDQ